MVTVFKRWWSDETGQDLIEYALLTSTIGLAAYAGVAFLRTALHDTYITWDTSAQDCKVVEVDTTLCP